MAESVDALVSNTSGAIRAGSTPALGTVYFYKALVNQVFARVFYFLRCTKSVLNNKKPSFVLSLRFIFMVPLPPVASTYRIQCAAIPVASTPVASMVLEWFWNGSGIVEALQALQDSVCCLWCSAIPVASTIKMVPLFHNTHTTNKRKSI